MHWIDNKTFAHNIKARNKAYSGDGRRQKFTQGSARPSRRQRQREFPERHVPRRSQVRQNVARSEPDDTERGQIISRIRHQ